MAWEDLLDIAAEAVAIQQAEESQPDIACEVDGEPLSQGQGGQLFCRFCGRRYPQDAA